MRPGKKRGGLVLWKEAIRGKNDYPLWVLLSSPWRDRARSARREKGEKKKLSATKMCKGGRGLGPEKGTEVLSILAKSDYLGA